MSQVPLEPATTAGPQRPAAPPPPPPKVAAAAASCQLGHLMLSQQGSNPVGNMVFGLISAGVVAGLGVLAMWGGAKIELRALAVLGLLGVVAALIIAVYSIMALLAGFTATYVYANGLVHVKNRQVQVVAWPEVDELWLWRAGGNNRFTGKLLCYYVVTFDGRKVPVESASSTGDKSLGEQLEAQVRTLGRPVSDNGPYVGRLRP